MPFDDGCWRQDGTRLQSYLARDYINRNSADKFGAVGYSVLGLVIKTIYKDASESISGSYTEYDVRLADYIMELKNVPMKGFHLSRTSGEEAPLKAASEIPVLDNPASARENILSSDGDLVVVEFVSSRYPLITGTINHLKSGEDTAPWSGATTEGERRALHHNESSIVMQEDSNMVIDVPSDKSVTINLGGTQAFQLIQSGGVITVELGDGTGEKLILGETFRTWFNGNIHGHTHGAGTYVAPSGGGAVTGSSGSLSATMPTTHLSNTSKTQA